MNSHSIKNFKEEVYVKQPEGFFKSGKEHLVYRLLKALYGLRKAPRAWYSKLNKCLKELGFVRCAYGQAVYTKNTGKYILIIGVYVDDLLVTGSNIVAIKEFKLQMARKFDMSDLGKLKYYLGYRGGTRERLYPVKAIWVREEDP